MKAVRDDHRRRSRHGRLARGHDVDVRLQRGVRADQRGVPNMRPQTGRSAWTSSRCRRRSARTCRSRRRTSCRCSISSHEELDRALALAAGTQGGPRAGPRRTPAAGRPARGAAVREAVAAHAHDLHDRRFANWAATSIEAARGRRVRRPRDGRGRGAQPGALGERRRRPHLSARPGWRDSPRPRRGSTSSTPSRTRSIRARRWPTC